METNFLDLSEREAASRGIARLPHTLGEAIERFESSELMRDALGEHIFEYLIAAKRREWDEYCTTVTDWERQRYYIGL